MTDLDAMEHNGRTHRGDETGAVELTDSEDAETTVGEDELWEELDTL